MKKNSLMKKVRDRAVVYLGLLVFAGVPAYFIARGILASVSDNLFTFDLMHWGAWIATVALTLVVAIVLMMMLVNLVLFAMVAFKH